MSGVEHRSGSQRDEEALCRTFYEFGFNPTVKRNLKLKELDKVARERMSLLVYSNVCNTNQSKFLKMFKTVNTKDFKKYACCVVIILSHGHQNETIYAADGPFNLQHMLVDRVAMNRSLQGKAKIFIVAACKGDAEINSRTMVQPRMQADSVTMIGEPKLLPYMRDTLKCYSTYEGFVSYRDPERGTIFVQELCRVLAEHGRTMYVEDVLKRVNVALTERAKYATIII